MEDTEKKHGEHKNFTIELLKKHGEHKKISTELLNNTSVHDSREARTNTETIKVMKFRNWKFRNQNQTFNVKLSTEINVDTLMNKLSSTRVVGVRQ